MNPQRSSASFATHAAATRAAATRAAANYATPNPRPIPVRVDLALKQRKPASVVDQLSSPNAGAKIAEREVPGFHVVEFEYPAGIEVNHPVDEHARLTYVLDGEYVESNGSGLVCQARSLRFQPAGSAYSIISKSGARCLEVSIERDIISRVGKYTDSLSRPAGIQTPAAMWLTQRLYREFQQRDASSAVSLEGILLELLAETARYAGSGPVRIVPDWLRVARAYVESNYLRPLSLADIARVAHVHRVHLARQFRSYFATSVGEFLRRKRVEHACHLVSTTNSPLAEVAIDCGFSDQSHFSATFRKLMGLTPARFREMAQSQDSPVGFASAARS